MANFVSGTRREVCRNAKRVCIVWRRVQSCLPPWAGARSRLRNSRPVPTATWSRRPAAPVTISTISRLTGGLSPEDWDGTLDDMFSYGARFTPEERKLILEYLVTYLPKK